MIRQFGLIGFPLSHSFSKGYFTEKFTREGITNAIYENYPLSQIREFADLCDAHPDFTGLNVTIPYKESVIPFLDDLSDEAKVIGAVNTIHFREGKKIGYNTDAHGFELSLMPLLRPHHQRALVLGTGGASKAVMYVLDKLGIPGQYVSRNKAQGVFAYHDLTDEIISTHTLIINTSPLGMYPYSDVAPSIPYTAISRDHLLYDLIYNPPVTHFMQMGLDRGAQVKNGLEMLHLQAERAWEIWNSRDPKEN
jgi:shikimate dehydrogenase